MLAGGHWRNHIDTPAYKDLTERRPLLAVSLSRFIPQRPYALPQMNERSLRYRDKAWPHFPGTAPQPPMHSIYHVDTDHDPSKELAVRRILEDAEYTQKKNDIKKQPRFIRVCPRKSTFYYYNNDIENAEIVEYTEFLETPLRDLRMRYSRVFLYSQRGLLIEVLKGDGETTPYGAVQITADVGYTVTPDIIDDIAEASRTARQERQSPCSSTDTEAAPDVTDEKQLGPTPQDVPGETEDDALWPESFERLSDEDDGDEYDLVGDRIEVVLELLEKASDNIDTRLHKEMSEHVKGERAERPDSPRLYEASVQVRRANDILYSAAVTHKLISYATE